MAPDAISLSQHRNRQNSPFPDQGLPKDKQATPASTEASPLIDVSASVNEYLAQQDWRVNANANQGYSLGGLILNVSGKVIANYWLSHIYPPDIGNAHRVADLHIHDLDMLSGYCAGW